MEQLIKATVSMLAQAQGAPMTLAQIRAKLEKKFPLLSFVDEDLVNRLSVYPEIKMDNTPNGQKISIGNEKLIKQKNCFDIICANYVDDESQSILYNFYTKISKAGPQGIKYNDLQKKIKETKKQKQFSLQQISHYCRRLVKIKLIKITHPQKQLLKFAISTRFFKQKNASLPPAEQSKKEQLKIQTITNHMSPFTFINNTFSFQELTFDQNLKLNQQSVQAFKQNGLTINQLIQKLNRNQGKKFISKIFQKLEKDDPEQQIIADREGKNIQLRYWSKNKKIYDKFLQMERKNKQILNENANNNINNNLKVEIKYEQNSLIKKEHCEQSIYLNQDSFSYFQQLFINDLAMQKKIQNQLGQNLFVKFIQSSTDFTEHETSIISFAMTKVLIENIECLNIKNSENKEKHINQIKNMKRQLNELKIKRYILIINKIYEQKVIAIYQLRQYILQLEQFEGLGKIDRKTLNYVLHTLEKIQLIKLIFRDIGFNYIQSEKSLIGKVNDNIALYKNVNEDDVKIEEVVNDVKSLKIGQVAENNEVKKEKKKNMVMENEENIEEKVKPTRNNQQKKINFNDCKVAAIEYKCMIFAKFFVQVNEQFIKRRSFNKVFYFILIQQILQFKLKLEFSLILHYCSNILSTPIVHGQKENNLEYFLQKFKPCNPMSYSFPYEDDNINDKYLENVGEWINDSETIGDYQQQFLKKCQKFNSFYYQFLDHFEDTPILDQIYQNSNFLNEKEYKQSSNQYQSFNNKLNQDFQTEITLLPIQKKSKTSNLTTKQSIRILFKLLSKYPEKPLSFLYGKIQNSLKILDLLLFLKENGYLEIYKYTVNKVKKVIDQKELEELVKENKYGFSKVFYKMAPDCILPSN